MYIAGLTALVVGLVLQPIVMSSLRHRGILDHPSARSSHVIPTVRGGGVAIVGAALAGTLAAVAFGARLDPVAVVILVVIVCCTALGLAEDLVGVSASRRFALQLVITAPFGLIPAASTSVGIAFAALGILFAVSVVNAVNFMDGINGISSAQGTAAGLALALVAHNQRLDVVAVVAASVAGAAASFAPYNVPRARVFLGDSGSYGLGAALAGLTIALMARGVPAEAAVAPLAITLVDTGGTLLRRVRAGEPWYLPHRTHVYQRLTEDGLTHAQVSILVFVLVAMCSALGMASLSTLPVRLAADIVLAFSLAGYLALPRILRATRGAAQVASSTFAARITL